MEFGEFSPLNNIVVAGKSGAGKQPRIDVLIEQFGLQQLSTGNIFREYLGAYKKIGHEGRPADFVTPATGAFAPDAAILDALSPLCAKAGVEPAAALLGLKAAHYVDQGLFVPDSITNELFAAAFHKANGRKLVLDGYPRTPEQAQFLLELVAAADSSLDLVLLVDNENEAIVARTTGRRICPACSKVFHLEFKPPRAGRICTACSTEVIQRSDDTEEKIRKRLQEYENKARPAVETLLAAGIPLATVPGNLPVFTDEAVRESVLSALREALR